MLKIIDLFAGIGGMRHGVELAAKKLGIDVQTVFCCEKDEKAVNTYKINFSQEENIFGDIKKLKTEDISRVINNHDLLLAGFPCPGFSLAGVVKRKSLGKKHGFSDTKGNLFPDIVRILKVKKPKAFLLENVPYILSHNKGRTFKRILKGLENVGYYVPQPEVLTSSDFGLPQKRRRIFIVGFHKFTLFNYPLSNNNNKGLKSILEKKVDEKYFISKKLWKSHIARKKRNLKRNTGFGYGLVNEKSLYTRTLSSRYYKDGSEILLQVKGRETPRKLTPRECARLQGFPNSFKIPVSDVEAYKQFGNSVSVPVVKAIALEMLKNI
jgi:DNA (cytosine-5)-methyltransferase 1|tara:strand:- start:13 stop:984 length:972 start_codon:yes stop_codon:yes gene_type:complete